MPPIQPGLIKQQAARISEFSNEPSRFTKELSQLLEYYGEKTFRQGRSGEPKPLTPAFAVPPPLLKILLTEFTTQLRQEPLPWLAICDQLWAVPQIELRLLSAWLLGKFPVEYSEPVLDRIRLWTPSEIERQLQIALLTQGTVNLRKENSQAVFALAKDWLSSGKNPLRGLGFQILDILAQDPNYENLPNLYSLITPYIINIDPGLRQEVVDTMGGLVRRSPTETAFFLRNAMENARSQDTAWLIRQLLPDFPPDTRESLRITVRR